MTGVAIFSTYPPSEGFGGPARILQQRIVLEASGYAVTHVVIQSTPHSGIQRAGDIVRFYKKSKRAWFDHVYDDVDLGHRAHSDSDFLSTLLARLGSSDVSVIILEQPFLAELVASVARDIGAAVVYSCQNIEYRLRRDLERFQPDWKRLPRRFDEVRHLEQLAIEISAAVTAIARTDQQMLVDEFGCESTLVPNGSSLAALPLPDSRLPDVDFAFAGSSYWPNVEGFAQIAMPSLAFLPPKTRLHIAGSVSGALLDTRSIARRHSVNASRMVLHGFVEASELALLMASARAVMVPVFVGEGSNLKSADALACGAPVIMTERATRGYEDVIAHDSEGVTVVDSAADFRLAMATAIQRDRPTTPVGLGRRSMLTWKSRLAPLPDVVRSAHARVSSR